MTAHREAIDMAGQTINGWLVVERAYGVSAKAARAQWWVRCPACAEQHYENGTKLRAAQRGQWIIWCRSCRLDAPPA